jgi:dienelactone hydrolase
MTRALLMAGIIAAAATAAFAEVPSDVAAKLAAIGRVVDPAKTAEIYAPLQTSVMPVAGIKAQRDIAYGPAPKETLDTFSPEAKGPARPILIFVHGGGFVGGDKSKTPQGAASPFYDNMMIWAVKNGLVGVNINYTWAPEAKYPQVQHQIASAVAWARKNAASFGGDPNRIVIWGHSAGASHVGSFIAHPETYADVTGAKAPLQGAIMTSGTYELSGTKDNVYFGAPATFAERGSTAGLIQSKTALLVMHAELDPPFMVADAEKLDAALTKAGRAHEAATNARHSHMSESYSVNTDDQSVSGPALAFIRKSVK